MNTLRKSGTSYFLNLTGKAIAVSILMFMFVVVASKPASAHCDGLDGPVVNAARKALETKNVNLVLVWVQNDDDAYIRKAFEKTVKLRAISPEAKELADMYFFETLVRVHRAGEGAPYTGLKPANRDLGPAIPAADASIPSGSPKEVWTLLSNYVHDALHEKFEKVNTLKNYGTNDVTKGREFVKAYVEYLHFVEKVHAVAGAESSHSGEASEHNH
ncbi:MAG TPA: hypothetical protein DHV48_01515 [Prolixibacteraceae bacterium]|nr:hypothetical protein [Prolixibacteraceae bacterium]